MGAEQQYPSVAVVILNWNGKNYLESYLPSLMQTDYENFFVVVADNGSEDDSVQFIQENYPALKAIELDKNYGFAEGYNRALDKVDASYYVLLNSDIEVDSRWLRPMVALLESHPEIAACQPKVRSLRDKTMFEYAGAAGGWLDKYGYPFCRGRVFDHCERDDGQYDDVAEVFWATGACLMVRPGVFKKIGGFDPFFFAHQEEIDLCWRMKNAGYKIFVQPNAFVYHLGGGSLAMGNKQKVFLNMRNNLIMLQKNLPKRDRRKILFIRMILDSLTAYRFLLKGKGGSFLAVMKAHWGFYQWKWGGRSKLYRSKQFDAYLSGRVDKSIVWEYFIKRKKTFSQIVENKN